MLNEPQTLRAHTWVRWSDAVGVKPSWSKLSCVFLCISGATVKGWRRSSRLRRSQRALRGRTVAPCIQRLRLILRGEAIQYIPPRPPELEHLTDEAASTALAGNYGNFRLAARELGVDAKLLRRLFWHNPRIMDTSKERIELFHSMVIDELVVQLNGRSYAKHLRAAAELVDYPTIRPVPGLGKLLTRDIKKGKPRGRHARKPRPVDVEAVFEREVERRVELEGDRILDRERGVVMVDRRPPAVESAVSSWRGIRRPSRGGGADSGGPAGWRRRFFPAFGLGDGRPRVS